MKIIGITGGTGCGKTTVLNCLESLGAKVIDCDELYHNMLKTDIEMLESISERFPGIIEDGTLDTKKLGKIVFNNPKGLSDLSSITHKFICANVKKEIIHEKYSGGQILGIDAIQLIESGLSDFCSRIIGVIADENIRLRRIMARDGISMEYAKSRISSQKPNSFFIENCDLIIENNSKNLASFEEECLLMIENLLQGISKEEEL